MALRIVGHPLRDPGGGKDRLVQFCSHSLVLARCMPRLSQDLFTYVFKFYTLWKQAVPLRVLHVTACSLRSI